MPETYDPEAEQQDLAAVGAAVRARLDADPSAMRIPTDEIEAYAVADFLTPAECERFTVLVDQNARPSATFDNQEEDLYRTSYSGDVNPYEPFVAMIERRINDLLGIDPSFGETSQGQRYEVGQEYQAHCDFFGARTAFYRREQPAGGQRSWTAMIYLNDVEEGGATDFMHIGITFTPRQGMLLTWNNMKRDGSPNINTLHAAKPVEAGVKYVITKWYRSRKWTPQYLLAEQGLQAQD